MSKKMKICLTALTLAVVMVVLAVAVCAVDHWYAYSYPHSGTVKYTGLLKTVRNSTKADFIRLGATARIDPSGTGGPTSVSMDVQIVLEAESDRVTVYTNKDNPEIKSNLDYGDYFAVPYRTFTEAQDIDVVRGMFYYKESYSEHFTKVITTEKCVHDEPEE